MLIKLQKRHNVHHKNNLEIFEGETENKKIPKPKERYISPEKTQQIIDDLRLIQCNNGISKTNKSARQWAKSTI